jgi:hypothetical protein
MPCDIAIDGVVGVCIRLAWMVCSCGWVERVMERGNEKQTTFVLSVRFVLPIENLMMDGGCIATTGGSSLFCI